MTKTILLVDDEPTQLRVMESVVTRQGFNVRTAQDGQEALHILEGAGASGIDLMVLDLSMPKVDGLEVLKTIQPTLPHLPIIVLTGHTSLTKVVECMQAGANDFISKPASAEKIRNAIENALDKGGMVGNLEPVAEVFTSERGFKPLVGTSQSIKDAVKIAKKAAATSIPVLIEGESGVGKEVFANAIHTTGNNKDKPMIAVNCGAIPENLVESILFGHEKGAFTGASDRHIGKFEEADGGTLFLDEIGELPLDIQVKLLRAIQEGQIERVGGRKPISVKIRLISATNRTLAEEVANGNFREDLFYRLNVFPLKLPSLRERSSDIPMLVEHFIKLITSTEGLAFRDISDEAISLLQNYPWPGNIRQLQNAIFRAIVMAEGEKLEAIDFPQIYGTPAPTHQTKQTGLLKSDDASASPAAFSGVGNTSLSPTGQVRPLSDIEKEHIEFALDHYEGRMSEVARRLEIGRSTLYRKMEEYGLEKPKK